MYQPHMLFSVEWGLKMIMHGDKERIWKGVAVVCLQALSRDSTRETEENHEIFQSISRDVNPVPLENNYDVSPFR
jgi:hypothetical protein